MALIQSKAAQGGYTDLVEPGQHGLQYLGLGLLSLGDGEAWEMKFGGREAVLVIVSGHCDMSSGGTTWDQLGQREDVFDGPPTSVYCPPESECRVVGRGAVSVAVCTSLAERGAAPTLIRPEDVVSKEVGRDSFQRTVRHIVSEDSLPAQRILVGETLNPPGRWSSFPPHKHDSPRLPEESKLEEVYYYRVRPKQGFGVQRVYGDGLDETYAIQDGDAVAISHGYHPVAAPPGYELYYLWVLAGEERIMRPYEDPNHAWVATQDG